MPKIALRGVPRPARPRPVQPPPASRPRLWSPPRSRGGARPRAEPGRRRVHDGVPRGVRRGRPVDGDGRGHRPPRPRPEDTCPTAYLSSVALVRRAGRGHRRPAGLWGARLAPPRPRRRRLRLHRLQRGAADRGRRHPRLRAARLPAAGRPARRPARPRPARRRPRRHGHAAAGRPPRTRPSPPSTASAACSSRSRAARARARPPSPGCSRSGCATRASTSCRPASRRHQVGMRLRAILLDAVRARAVGRGPRRCCTRPTGPSTWRRSSARPSTEARWCLRPLRRLLAGLPGGRAGAGPRGRGQDQRLGDRRAGPAPDRADRHPALGRAEPAGRSRRPDRVRAAGVPRAGAPRVPLAGRRRPGPLPGRRRHAAPRTRSPGSSMTGSARSCPTRCRRSPRTPPGTMPAIRD